MNEYHPHQSQGLHTKYGGPATTTLADAPRPSKLFDAGHLDAWLREHYPDVMGEWEYGIKGEWPLGLWDWLELEHVAVLDEFIVAWA